MRLIKLTCDQATFKPVVFNPSGITFIVGDSPENKQGSSNGVGKTLTLGLVHHCLGATSNKLLSKAVPHWMFSLLFSVNGKEYQIDRSGDGKKIFLNGNSIQIKALREMLNQIGGFSIDKNIPTVSFRSLFKRFARYEQDDCINPIKTKAEKDVDAILKTLYLLGIDCSLVVSKQKHKHELDDISQIKTMWKQDSVLHNMFRAGTNPKVRAKFLEAKIEQLTADLAKFQIAENYRDIELSADNLTKQMRSIEKEMSIIQFQLDNIDKSLERHPDISKNDLLDLYDGLQNIFKPEVLAHFDAVEAFHNSLAINRRTRFENDKLKLKVSYNELDEQRKSLSKNRDGLLQSLQGKRALDEYATIAQQLANYEQEKERLTEFLTFSDNLQEKSQYIKEVMLEEDRLALDYLKKNPITNIVTEFTELAQKMYPNTASGIELEVNTRENQLRYDLSVQIDGDASDGINAARILCFDWTVFMFGANHSMDMLWHDNRLFADMDPIPRAKWFEYIHESLKISGKQYIATINTENYNSMKEYLSQETLQALDSSVVLKLIGDQDSNRLLGIRFG